MKEDFEYDMSLKEKDISRLDKDLTDAVLAGKTK